VHPSLERLSIGENSITDESGVPIVNARRVNNVPPIVRFYKSSNVVNFGDDVT
jgi:hypothetical protein